MRIQILSDTHHEFYRNLDYPYIRAMDLHDIDVVVLAGDICSRPSLGVVLEEYARRGCEIVYVAGNHEYYLGTKPEVWETIDDIVRDYPNFHWLNNDSVVINGQRFIGGTLWYPGTTEAILGRNNWSDFIRIFGKPGQWIFEEAKRAKQYLVDNVEENDIVVTHMLPSWQSVDPQYKHADTNCFFINDCERLIQEVQPKLWVHGHTHCSMDYKIMDTRIIANPRGYPNRWYGHGMSGGDNPYENPNWQERLVIEV